jgi:hypothetical protein
MIGRLNRAARAILEARRTGALLDTLAPNDQPRSLEEGYTIQQLVTAALETACNCRSCADCDWVAGFVL